MQSEEHPGLVLRFSDPSMVELPAELTTSDLSAEEIGAIFCWASLQAIGFKAFEKRLKDPAFMRVSDTLKAKGILSASLEGNKLSFKIDLNSVLPAPEACPS